MKQFRLKSIFSLAALLVALLFSNLSYGQAPIPFVINNTSPFADSDLFVAIVGINPSGAHVWINPRNSQVLPMDKSYNTVKGPVYGGNQGPGQNALYANCFARLSEIPNKTFSLPAIAGCRVFIAKGQQLYFYFHGSTGATVGYTSPNHLDPTDPNQNIMFEIIELTYNQYGFFGNPSRVDAFKYPIGLELFGANGYQQRVGELKTHAEIISLYKANVPAEFQGTVNSLGEIWAPSKTAAFQDGTNGTTPGPYGNYFKSYIDAIWNKYKNEDLIFFAGDAGVFRGRVIGERLEVVGQSGQFVGRKGMVERRPTTQEALEGKGVLDKRLVDGDLDLVIQAQLTAAINRHMVNVTTPNPGQQNWYDKTKFYQGNPTNHYAKFWHLPGISVNNLSYGFAYDDVADHSPSLHTPNPTRVVTTFGGYAGGTPPQPPPPTGVSLPGTVQAENYSSMLGVQTETTTDAGGGQNVGWIETGDYMNYAVNVTTAGTYTVGFRVASQPGGGQAQLRNSAGTVLATANIPATGGWQTWTTINATATLPAGAQTLRVHASAGGFNINWIQFSTTTTCNATAITPYLTVNGGAWQQTASATLNAGGSITLGPAPTTGGSWSWSGPGGFTATTREITRSNIQTTQAGNYVATHTNSCGARSTQTFSITVNTVSTGVSTVYKDCNYGGTAVSLPVGDYTLAQLNSRGVLNKDISSLRVTSGYRVTLYETDNFGGASLAVTADNSCLVGAGWNDRTTSVRVATATTTNTFSQVIEAENYIAMAGIQTEACSEGTLNVGWIDAGDWMAYNVNIPTAGTYRILYRVASPNAGRTLRLERDGGATLVGTVTIPNTGGWQTWATVAHNVTLPAGQYAIGLATATGGFNINKFTITNNLSARLDNGLDEVTLTNALYPNPVRSKLNLTSSLADNASVQILDLRGNEISKSVLLKGGKEIDLTNLAPGGYIIKITSNGKSIVKKISKE